MYLQEMNMTGMAGGLVSLPPWICLNFVTEKCQFKLNCETSHYSVQLFMFAFCRAQVIYPREIGSICYNLKKPTYVCITTHQPDTESNPNPNPTTKQHATVHIQLNVLRIQRNSHEKMLLHLLCDFRL